MRSPFAVALGTLFVVGTTLAGCDRGSDGSAPPAPSVVTVVPDPTPAPSGGAATPQGFRAAVVHVRRADGRTVSYCVWLATTEPEREQGLMSVTSLGGADGMVFRFGGDQSSRFWMKDTVLPLSIAFFDQAGRFVSATDMDPCPPGTASCPTYGADGAYADALEVGQGRLSPLGIGAGSSFVVTDETCSPAR